MSFTVAIDGPAAAGKGTIARAIAERFGFHHLDTGLLYRVVGLKLLEAGTLSDIEAQAPVIAGRITEADLSDKRLRDEEVSAVASSVAAIPAVRDALIRFQRRFAAREGGVVLDGRDIGTVVCPDAEVKLYVTAREDIRAERRFVETRDRADAPGRQVVLEAIRARDSLDSGRSVAPLRRAKDAVLLDTSEMSIETAVATAMAVVEARHGQGR